MLQSFDTCKIVKVRRTTKVVKVARPKQGLRFLKVQDQVCFSLGMGMFG